MTRRLQIRIDEVRYERVATIAARRHMSVAAVVREAIDRDLVDDARRNAGATHILSADAMPMPATVDELLGEVSEARSRRLY